MTLCCVGADLLSFGLFFKGVWDRDHVLMFLLFVVLPFVVLWP